MRTFDGSTQRIQSNVNLGPAGDFSIFGIGRILTGFAGYDRFLSNRIDTEATVGFIVGLNSAGTVMRLLIASGGSWVVATGATSMVANTTYRFFGRYDSTAKVAYIYVDDADVADGTSSAGSGSHNVSTGDFTIGSNPDVTGGSGWWGNIGEVAVWHRDLPLVERKAIMEKNISPEFFPNNRVFYSKLIRGAVDVHGSVLTEVASPGVYPHAPIIYQAQNRVIVPAAPAAGAIMNQLQRRNLGADLFDGTLQ